MEDECCHEGVIEQLEIIDENLLEESNSLKAELKKP
jgi:hypothetical protein